jgi:mannitol/fructose-specific phosphotransferase system IIA component (Ntr-type)
VSARPLDFAALDGQPVRLFFLLVGPESAAGAHVKALSRISRLVRSEELRRRLLDAATASEFMAVVAEAEAA